MWNLFLRLLEMVLMKEVANLGIISFLLESTITRTVGTDQLLNIVLFELCIDSY